MIQIFIINGLMCGGVYSLLAIGFSLIFGAARILNIAHTAFYMLAAFIVYIIATIYGLSLPIAIVLALLIPPLIAMGYYKLVIDRVKQHDLAVLIITLALALLFQEILLIVFKGHYRAIEPFIPGFAEILGIRISHQYFLSMGGCFATLGIVGIILHRSKLGNAIRAVSQDMEIASLMGMDVTRVSIATMGISAALAGVAAVLIAPIFIVEPMMWMSPLVVVIAAVVLGGLGSIRGSVIGGFILGFAEIAVVTFIPMGSFLRGVASLVAMVIVLITRPEGLFGVAFEEERL